MRTHIARTRGSMLFEMVLGLSVLLMSVLAYVGSMTVSFRSHQESGDLDRAEIALQNVAEFLRGQDPSVVFAQLHNSYVEVPALDGGDGQPARLSITCVTDETAIPADLAPVVDLDGIVASDSTNVSGEYRLLPVRLTVVWLAAGEKRLLERYVLLGGFADVEPEARDTSTTGMTRVLIGTEQFDDVVEASTIDTSKLDTFTDPLVK